MPEYDDEYYDDDDDLCDCEDCRYDRGERFCEYCDQWHFEGDVCPLDMVEDVPPGAVGFNALTEAWVDAAGAADLIRRGVPVVLYEKLAA